MSDIDVEAHKAIRGAIKRGDLTSVVSLIDDNESRLRMMTPFGTWLHVAASFGHVELVKWLLSRGLDVNAYGGVAGGAPLNEAASDGHIAVVKCLLEQGALLDTSEPERNPLFGAIHNGHTEIAKVLIDCGIDIHIKYSGENMQNMDALAFAREWGRKDIASLLIAAGAQER